MTVFPKLRETPSADPAQRTEWNVRDSDVTLILLAWRAPRLRGYRAHSSFRVHSSVIKPLLVADLSDPLAEVSVRGTAETAARRPVGPGHCGMPGDSECGQYAWARKQILRPPIHEPDAKTFQ